MPEYPYNFAGQLEEILKELSKIQTPWSKALQGMLKQQKAQTSTANVTGQQPASTGNVTAPQDTGEMPPEAYDDFWAWAKWQYGRGQYNISWQGVDPTPYYEHWTQYLWNPKHPLETPPPAGEAPVGTTPTLAEESLNPPAAPVEKDKMPDTITLPNGEVVAVNYVNYGTIRNPAANALIAGKTMAEIDAMTEEEAQAYYASVADAEKYITLYAPVLPADKVTPENMQAVYKNIIGMDDNGKFYNEGIPLKPQELASVIDFDPLTQTGDLSELTKINTYVALKKLAAENIPAFAEAAKASPGTPLPNDMIDEFIQKQALAIAGGQQPGMDYIQNELKKMSAEYQVANPEAEKQRLESNPAYRKLISQGMTPEQAMAEVDAKLGKFKGVPQSGIDETQDIQLEMERLKDAHDQYRQLIDSGQLNEQSPGSTSEAIGLLAMNKYEQLEKRLGEIQGGALPRIGRVGQFDPGQSKRLAEIANELGVPYAQVAALGQNYLGNVENPEFSRLKPGESTKLVEAGRIVQGQTFEEPDPLEAAQKLKATEEAAYQALLKKARQQQNQPQRLARL